MTALCLAGGGVVLRLAVTAFTLAWSHTVEHTLWEEDWQVRPDALRLDTARVEGSGAGMEPGPDARRIGSMWVWHPGIELDTIVLRRSAGTEDWTLCIADTCRMLGDLLPPQADPARLSACD